MATTKGYHSYHGRGNVGKIILCILLVLVILAAVAYFALQNYMVYDADGNMHLELPHYYRQEEEEQETPSLDEADVELDILEPERKRPVLGELHATELKYGSLWWNTDYVLTLAPEAMVIDVKQKSGGVTYESSVPGVPYAEPEPTLSNLKTLLASDKYAIARVACFCDSLFDKNDKSVALYRENGVRWYDGTGYAWLDPSSPAAQEYLTALANEFVSLGFDELLLDYFSYPTNGDWENIPSIQGAQKEQVLTDFITALREALPETVALSTVLRSEISADYGLSEAFLLENFDRVYVTYGLDASALQTAAAGSDAEYVAQIVPMVYTAPAQGGYVKLWYDAPAT